MAQTEEFNLIVGLGATGLSIVRYLRKRRQTCIVFDNAESPPALAQLKQEFPEVSFYSGNMALQHLTGVTRMIVSPGVPPSIPIVVAAKVQGIPVLGDVELFAQHNTKPVVAITGTNGKSTVTTLVGKMAQAAGKKVAVGGNLGEPVLNFLQQDNYELFVLEVSSFQLDTTTSLRPTVAALLNITPDHLYRYGTLANYVTSKHQVFSNCQAAVYNREDTQTHPQSIKTTTSFGLDHPNQGEWGIRQVGSEQFLAFENKNLLSISELKIAGRHNWNNALAALAIGKLLGLEIETMLSVLREFPGLAHRCQWVREKDQINWYNDSKGTNVGAAISAIQGLGGAMQGKIVLIAGGQGEGADFTEMHGPVKDYVRTLVLIGEDADKIAVALDGAVPIIKTGSMDDAVKVAQQNAQPGDAVLLSPACKSFDMFKNYAHRGDVFMQSVESL